MTHTKLSLSCSSVMKYSLVFCIVLCHTWGNVLFQYCECAVIVIVSIPLKHSEIQPTILGGNSKSKLYGFPQIVWFSLVNGNL
jgi:hypothetical protein